MNKHRRRQMRANLRWWYAQATDVEINVGLRWYEEAQEFSKELAERFNTSGEICAGVISALSPNNKWGRNKIDAEIVLSAVREGVEESKVKVCTYNNNKRKAFAIAGGSIRILKQSPKTYAFARNVGEMDEAYVTIDKWHLRACQSRSKTSKEVKTTVTPKQYGLLQKDCLKVADEFGLRGYEFQAIVWNVIRNRWLNLSDTSDKKK